MEGRELEEVICVTFVFAWFLYVYRDKDVYIEVYMCISYTLLLVCYEFEITKFMKKNEKKNVVL